MPRKKNAVTIYSLSEELGYSPATISKALKNYAEISEEVREQVQLYAEKVGFKPRRFAQRTINVCVLIRQFPGKQGMFSPFVTTVLEGVSRYSSDEGIEFSLFGANVEKLNSGELVRELRKRNADGCVVLQADESCHFLDEFEKKDFPFVCLQSHDGKRAEKNIEIDNALATEQAVHLLTQLGHKKIATLVSPPSGASATARFTGYEKALNGAGLSVDPELVLYPKTDCLSPLEAANIGVEALLRRRPDITAVFCMSYYFALGASRALCRLGISVPSDMSLIGMGDYPLTGYMNPPLTVVDIPDEKLGYHAARCLHDVICKKEKKASVQEDWMTANLVLRQSTGVARSHSLEL